jgi:hypothetical protein
LDHVKLKLGSILHKGQLEIPKHYQNREGSHTRVILLAENTPTKQNDKPYRNSFRKFAYATNLFPQP